MNSNKWHIYIKVTAICGLMAFIMLSSCNVRKGIQALLNQEIQKQLLPSKSIQTTTKDCFISSNNFDSEVNTTYPHFNFSPFFQNITTQLNKTAETIVKQTANYKYIISPKIGLYILFRQIKISH